MLEQAACAVPAPRILIIDNDPLALSCVRACERENHYEYRQVFNTEDGLVAIEQWRPDVILLDQIVPEREGWEILSEIMHSDWQSSVIFVTSDDLSSAAMEAKRRGASACLLKPLVLEQVATLLRNVLARRSQPLHPASPEQEAGPVGQAIAEGDTTPRIESPAAWQAFFDSFARDPNPQLYAKAILVIEKCLLPLVLSSVHGNVSQAAKILGMTRVSLRKKIRLLKATELPDEQH
jgi:DNA-binding NtrC family response regulator